MATRLILAGNGNKLSIGGQEGWKEERIENSLTTTHIPTSTRVCTPLFYFLQNLDRTIQIILYPFFYLTIQAFPQASQYSYKTRFIASLYSSV